MSSPPASLKVNEFLKRLKAFDVRVVDERGKGSELFLVRTKEKGATKGPSYTLKCHGRGKEVKQGTMYACLRRLEIDSNDFWDLTKKDDSKDTTKGD